MDTKESGRLISQIHPAAQPRNIRRYQPALLEARGAVGRPKASLQPFHARAEGGAAAGECPVAVEEGASITFSGGGDQTEQQIYRDSILRFQEVCPGVTVNYEPIPAEFQTRLKAAMAGGTAPDVFYVDDQLMTAFAPVGQLLPLDDYMAEAGVSEDQFLPQLTPIFAHEGQIYGLPKDWGTLGLVYLPEVFDAAGIDYPTEDWTWEDMRAAAQTIAENTDYAGYCQGADWARFAPMAFSNGGAFASDDLTQATLDTPEVKEMAQFTADMYAEGSMVVPADIAASWCGEAIGKQLVGMTLEGGWMVNSMRQDYPDVNWQAVLIPAGPVTRADVIFTNAIGVNAATDYPAAAAALAIYITSAENQAEIVQTGTPAADHGTAVVAERATAECGETRTVTVTPDEDYRISELRILSLIHISEPTRPY